MNNIFVYNFYVMKINLRLGFTNKDKTIKNGNLIIKKTYTGFNHKIDYSKLKEFDFVPDLIEDNKESVTWKLLKGIHLEKPTNDDLKKLAISIRKLHKSEAKFPKNNLRNRVNNYLRIIHDKYLKIPEVDNYWKEMNRLITRMNKINPCHNDIWSTNIIKDDNQKIWIIDWEFATMGDKHFDLAYYIEYQKLSLEQEKIFLDAYNSLDDYNAYVKEWMDKYKLFVNWLVLLWAYAQEKMPFSVKSLKKRINELASKVIKNKY